MGEKIQKTQEDIKMEHRGFQKLSCLVHLAFYIKTYPNFKEKFYLLQPEFTEHMKPPIRSKIYRNLFQKLRPR